MTERSGLLVLEPSERGHGLEWMLHLARHRAATGAGPRLSFLVPPRVADALRDALTGEAATVVALTAREQALCTDRRLAVSALSRWWVMRRHLRAADCDEGLFLEFDHLSLPLALGLPFGRGATVTGILFRPSVHYDRDTPASLKERLRDARKNLLYRLMLRHPALTRLHTLDDAFPAFARHRYRNGWKVTALADPAHPHVEIAPADRRLANEVPPDRMLFVLFGVLTERKGVLALLRALAALDPKTAARTAVIIAGEIDPPLRTDIEAAHAALSDNQPALWCQLAGRHLTIGEIAALIDRADVVLAPYQRFVGSSGVLMWAAGRGRPVISQDYGALGRLVREHRLGLTTDTTNPGALARAIERAVAGEIAGQVDRASMTAFAAARSPEAFSSTILGPHPKAMETGPFRGAEHRTPHPVTD